MVCEEKPQSFVLQSTDRFDVKGVVSGGGSGDIWVAFDKVLCTTVAIKRIFGWAADLRSLRAEVQAGRRIHSPHVLRIYDLIQLQRVQCIVMDYVEGETLHDRLRKGKIPSADAKKLIHQLCLGVAAIHKAGFAHCDLRPINILIDHEGKLIVVDLGLAEVLRAKRNSVQLDYRAPELRAPCHVIADIYALGGIISDIAKAGDLQAKSPKNGIAPILKKCLDSDPQRRYATVDELLRELEPHLLSTPVTRASTRISTKRLAVLSAVSILVIISIMLAGSRWKETARPSQVVVVSRTNDVRARMVVDLIALYLESNHLPVSCPSKMPDQIAAHSTRTGNLPNVISVTTEDANGKPLVRLEVTGRRSSTAVLPFSSRIISDSLAYIGPELNLATKPDSFRLPDISDDARKFAEAWSGPESNSALPDLQSIPGLLLKAKAGQRRFVLTGAQEAKESALAALDTLKAQGVNTSQTVLLRAGILMRQSRKSDAVHLLQSSLGTLATTAPIYGILSDIELQQGFAQEALELAGKGVAQDPYSAKLHLSLARAQIVLGKDPDAIASLNHALALKEDALAHTTLGNLYILSGRFADATSHLGRALEMDPTAEGSIYFGLAQVLSGHTQEGILILNGAATLKPTLYSLGVLGAALRWDGNLPSATAALKKAVALGRETSSDGIELGRLAVAHAQLANIKKADELIKRADTVMAGQTELVYDAMIVDAFANRRSECAEKFELLKERRFPLAFALRDPQVAKTLGMSPR